MDPTHRIEHSLLFSDSTKSDYLTTNLGVPQGSFLGPLLFFLYANDLKHRLNEDFTLVYAVDLKVYVQMSVDQVSDGLDRLSKAGQYVTAWAHGAGLITNVRKTQAIFFGSSRYVKRLKALDLPRVTLGPTTVELRIKNYE